MRAVICCLAVAAVVGIVAHRAAAELPPDAYRAKQRAAPEFLEIKVLTTGLEANRTGGQTVVKHNVEAEVQTVHRTAMSLRPGARITIQYERRIHDKPMAGPSQVPALKKGQVAPAYLVQAKGEKFYSPAAGGYSFETVGRD